MTREELLLRGWFFITFMLPLVAAYSCWRARRRDVPWMVIWCFGTLAAAGIGAIGALSNDHAGSRYLTVLESMALERSWNALTPDERAEIRTYRALGAGGAVLLGIAGTHAAFGLFARRAR